MDYLLMNHNLSDSIKNSQQSVQITPEILRHFQAFLWLRVFPASKQSQRPAPPPVTPAVRRTTHYDEAFATRLKPSAELWSILEVVCHLYDEEREDFREHLDFILHRQNEEWHRIDTQGWVTQRKYNQQNFTEMQ